MTSPKNSNLDTAMINTSVQRDRIRFLERQMERTDLTELQKKFYQRSLEKARGGLND